MMSNTNDNGDIDESFISYGPYTQYTDEQKIVSAVWVHERKYTFLTIEELRNNFRIWFKIAPPKSETLLRWERKLFSEGTLSNTPRRVRSLTRLKYIPYIKASFREDPNLSVNVRAKKLGISAYTLRKIIEYDLTELDMNIQKVEPGTVIVKDVSDVQSNTEADINDIK